MRKASEKSPEESTEIYSYHYKHSTFQGKIPLSCRIYFVWEGNADLYKRKVE